MLPAHRVKNKLYREFLKFAGQPVGSLVAVGVENAAEVANAYKGVTAIARVESGGMTTLIPKHLPGDHLEFLQPFQICCETVLLKIENPAFSFCNLVLHDPQLNILFVETDPVDNLLSSRRNVPRRRRLLKGNVAYLSNTGVDNYYHWMQLTLPLLRHYRDLIPNTKIDYYYVGELNLTPSMRRLQEETLLRFDILPEQLIRRPCRAEQMLAAIYLHPPQYGLHFRDIWGHDFVRAVYAGDLQASTPRRIYVQRGNVRSRKVINESEVIEFLRRFGFRPVKMDGLSYHAQARLFSGAEAIVGLHGAALTNVIFAGENTKLIEMFPPGYREVSFFTAATYSKLDYYYLTGTKPANSAKDVYINVNKLALVLEMAQLTA